MTYTLMWDARASVGGYVERSHHRPHSALNYRTPFEVRETWDDGRLQKIATRTATDIPALSHTTRQFTAVREASDSLGMPQGRGRYDSSSAPMEGEAGAPVTAAALPAEGGRRPPDRPALRIVEKLLMGIY
jgi:hypothetical protein